jgi:hypothetical protein
VVDVLGATGSGVVSGVAVGEFGGVVVCVLEGGVVDVVCAVGGLDSERLTEHSCLLIAPAETVVKPDGQRVQLPPCPYVPLGH